ncbi:MAG TPA: hypothetical protein VMF31_07770 [Solirubrobacterales bacterium]|nr:hypothetical protein [Solirubrobacterales bacterium]
MKFAPAALFAGAWCLALAGVDPTGTEALASTADSGLKWMLYLLFVLYALLFPLAAGWRTWCSGIRRPPLESTAARSAAGLGAGVAAVGGSPIVWAVAAVPVGIYFSLAGFGHVRESLAWGRLTPGSLLVIAGEIGPPVSLLVLAPLALAG